MRLQLRLRGSAALAAALAALPLVLPAAAQPPGLVPAPRPAPPGETPGRLVARTSLEVAGYTDSDRVHVASPAISGSVANELAGWSVGGQYLLDAVSAASVDVVSTASPRWFEYRHVGSASLEYKAGDVALSGGGGVSREPDYQSLAGAARISIETPDKTVTAVRWVLPGP